MGSGRWDERSYVSYSVNTGKMYDSATKSLSKSTKLQDIYKSRTLDPALDPKNVTRVCHDSEEHPNTKPVILALDVTGSMGPTATEVASKLNVIMTDLYEKVDDIEFMIMGIGDFAYDHHPLQVSQFESDIRIAEQLDKIYFEGGGGGNSFESYTAAWKFALDHTELHCFDKRGEKGTIITIGDEWPNPYIDPDAWVRHVGGESLQGDIETKDLYKSIINKYNVYHIHVDHHHAGFGKDIYSEAAEKWKDLIGNQHVFSSPVEGIEKIITNIVLDSVNNNNASDSSAFKIPTGSDNVDKNEEGEVVW